MPFQDRTWCSFHFRVELHFREVASDVGISRIRLVSVRVQAGKEIVHHQRGEEHVDADNGRPILFDAAEVAFFHLASVEGGIGAPHLLCLDAGHCIDPPAQQAGEARLDVVHRAGDSVDTAFSVGIQPYPYVEVRKIVKRRQAIQYVSALDAVHAAENDVAFCDAPHSLWRDQIDR